MLPNLEYNCQPIRYSLLHVSIANYTPGIRGHGLFGCGLLIPKNAKKWGACPHYPSSHIANFEHFS